MTATGFDLHLFPKGDVQIDFLDGDGDTINSTILLVGNFFLWPLCELPDFCLRGTTARTPPGDPA